MIFCNICSHSIFVNIRLIIWFLELRFDECCHSCSYIIQIQILANSKKFNCLYLVFRIKCTHTITIVPALRHYQLKDLSSSTILNVRNCWTNRMSAYYIFCNITMKIKNSDHNVVLLSCTTNNCFYYESIYS